MDGLDHYIVRSKGGKGKQLAVTPKQGIASCKGTDSETNLNQRHTVLSFDLRLPFHSEPAALSTGGKLAAAN